MTRSPLDLFASPLDGVRLIEASAGTGKTWHLCGLVLRLLLERGLELPRILVLTFTNAATAELRERIRARLVESLAVLQGGAPAPGDPFVPELLRQLRENRGLDAATLARRLRWALQSFDEAAIFTLHGFCQRALAELPFAAGLPLALTPLADDSTLRLQAVHEFWRRHVAGEEVDPALAAHLAACKDTPERYAALLGRRLSKPLSVCRWPAALDAPEESTADAPGGALAAAYDAARDCWLREREAVARTLREAAPGLYAQSYGAESLAAALAGWQRWMHAGDALAPLDPEADRLELLAAATLAQRTRKGFQPPSHRFFGLADALLAVRRAMDRHLRLARLRLIRRLFDEAGAALRRRKRELRVAAFDDMLFNLHERLQAVPALAAALRERYPAALVDEFQDTDPLQWAILERVWGGDGGTPLLLVGDPKQAIYAFRNADLPTYLRARERADAVHTLDRNQRSSAALVSALNHLFGAHPRSFLLPGLDYRPLGLGERPRPAFEDETPAAGDLGALQLWLLPRDAGAQPLLREAALRASVQATAAEIARLLREGEARRLRLDGRPLAGGDIAVLVRSHAQGALVRQALAALGVGSVALTPAGVFQAPEAEALQSVLAAVLEPSHAGRLRAALATEAMGFDAAALAALEQDEAALAAHMERFAAWRACWLAHGVAAMLRRWLREAEVAARLLARPEGARRLTNLLHLAERLHEAAAQQASPEALLRWLALRRAQPGVDEADQLRLESDQALVRIVTIHKAKGLEYGVVFCPFLWDAQAPPAATPELVETHDAEGRPVLDLRAGVDDGFDDAALKLQQRTEQAAETLRLAYVALTRAVHRAYLVVGPYTARAGRGFSTQPGSRAALNWLAAGERFTEPAQWFEHALPPAEIEAAWRRLAAGCAALRLAPLPLTPGEPLPPAPARPLEALPPPRHIGAGWRVVEDEALTAGLPEPGQDALATGALGLAWTDASTDGATNTGRDEGGSAGAGAGAMFTVLPAALARDDILRFPQGAAAEAAIRLAFARADFADPASWEEAAWQALRAHPQPGVGGPGGEARERALAAMLQRMLRDVLSTEIAPGLRLRHLASGRWLSGMEFHLPAPGLRAEDLYAALRVLDLPPSAPDAPPLVGGYLRGVIDLVFEHEGRWWLLDWSAALPGQQARAYGAEALAHEAAARGHGLQALLHTLALQRWLRRRVPGWRPETHFGGALRLYVRGVRPGWTNEDGAACGVFLVQPAAEELGKLASLLEG